MSHDAATQGLGQLATGAWSDRVGRKPLIVTGMRLQAAGIAVVARSSTFAVRMRETLRAI